MEKIILRGTKVKDLDDGTILSIRCSTKTDNQWGY